jgi:hypothetical protein
MSMSMKGCMRRKKKKGNIYKRCIHSLISLEYSKMKSSLNTNHSISKFLPTKLLKLSATSRFCGRLAQCVQLVWSMELLNLKSSSLTLIRNCFEFFLHVVSMCEPVLVHRMCAFFFFFDFFWKGTVVSGQFLLSVASIFPISLWTRFEFDVSHKIRWLWSFPYLLTNDPARTVDKPFNCARKLLSLLSPWFEVGMGRIWGVGVKFLEACWNLICFGERLVASSMRW